MRQGRELTKREHRAPSTEHAHRAEERCPGLESHLLAQGEGRAQLGGVWASAVDSGAGRSTAQPEHERGGGGCRTGRPAPLPPLQQENL